MFDIHLQLSTGPLVCRGSPLGWKGQLTALKKRPVKVAIPTQCSGAKLVKFNNGGGESRTRVQAYCPPNLYAHSHTT